MSGTNKTLANHVARIYKSNFNESPEVVLRSPGRINLIGEHTDYNLGFVLPSAVSLGIYFAVGESHNNTHSWQALDKDETLILTSNETGLQRGDWSDFLHGAWLALRKLRPGLPYFNAVFSGDLPMGAGMSSSSALTCGVLFGLNELFGLKLSRLDIASIAHSVEREFIGLRGGIMDQYASVLSIPNHVLLIDCRDLSHTFVKIDEHINIFLMNTNVHRELTQSEYNSRSDECSSAVNQINHHIPCHSLRDIAIEQLLPLRKHIDPIPFKRVLYVLAENKRVHDAVEAIHQLNWPAVGNIMYSGHAGLRTEYEVSIRELDFLVEYTRKVDWIYGARMMGGGFGGCTINISTHEPSKSYVEQLSDDYYSQFGIKPTYIPVSLTGGTQLLMS